jgi:hypothetical protein
LETRSVASIRSDGIQSGWWKSATDRSDLTPQTLRDAIQRVNRPIFVVDLNGKYGVSQEGTITLGDRKPPGIDALPLIAYVPPLHPRIWEVPILNRPITFGMRMLRGPWRMG